MAQRSKLDRALFKEAHQLASSYLPTLKELVGIIAQNPKVKDLGTLAHHTLAIMRLCQCSSAYVLALAEEENPQMRDVIQQAHKNAKRHISLTPTTADSGEIIKAAHFISRYYEIKSRNDILDLIFKKP